MSSACCMLVYVMNHHIKLLETHNGWGLRDVEGSFLRRASSSGEGEWGRESGCTGGEGEWGRESGCTGVRRASQAPLEDY